MQIRKITDSITSLSLCGLGTWGLGGDSYGDITKSEAKAVISTALLNGITFFDTSNLYGDGVSEEILGEELMESRGSITICTKVGLLPHKSFYMPVCLEEGHILESLDGSLGRLSTNYLDIYLLHSPTIEDLEKNENIFSLFENLKKSEKIVNFGISTRSPGDALEIYKRWGINLFEINLNLIDQRAYEIGLLTDFSDINLIARTPLCFGFLSGRYTGNEIFPKNDHRSKWPRGQIQTWSNAYRKFQEIYESFGITPTELAFSYIKYFSSVKTIIPGMMSTGEVENSVKSIINSPDLTISDIQKIYEIYCKNNFYDKSSKE